MTTPDQHTGASDPARVVDALYRVNNFLAAISDLHDLLERIMDESKAVVGAEASSCLLYDDVTNELYFEVALGDKADGVKEIRLPMGAGIAGQCALERRTIVVNDVSQDSRHFKKADKQSQFETRNLLAAPMTRGDRLIGVLEVLNKNGDERFNDDDQQILEFFAGQAAIAIENALLLQAKVRGERLAAVGQAVAGISHYVKNILAGLKGATSLIDHALKTDNPDMIAEVWPLVNRNTDKISTLVQDMLTYSKEREPELSPSNLNVIVTETVDLCLESAENAEVTLVLEPDESLPDTALDVSRIGDTVLNLVGNAIDALREHEDATVTVRSAYDKKNALLRAIVADNGPGIPEEVQKSIFEPFFSTKGSKGTGLGLAVARKSVEEHGGAIELVSAPDEGATFTIILPAIDPESTTVDATD